MTGQLNPLVLQQKYLRNRMEDRWKIINHADMFPTLLKSVAAVVLTLQNSLKYSGNNTFS